MTVSQENLVAIQRAIVESPISRRRMQEDIIDHLCCEVEYRMSCGCDFDNAFEQALHLLAPNGLKELERETFFLLNSKTIIMKKLTYVSGAVFSILSSTGILFKILHWFSANEFLIIGFGGLLLIFLPLLWIARNKQLTTESSFDRRRNLTGFISLILISAGAVLKVLHLASANEILILGTIAFSFAFLPMTFIKMYKQAIAS
jgi:hypothetical protein